MGAGAGVGLLTEMTEYSHSFFSYLLSLEGGQGLAETKFQLLSFILVKLDCL